MPADGLKLYSYYRSSASYRVRIALNLKGLAYEYHPVHLVKDGGEQHNEAYKKLNPSAELPTLVHGEKTLSQSMAICLYLEDISPGTPSLFNADPYKKAKMIQACEIINSGIQPLQNLRVLKQLVKNFGFQEDQKLRWIRHWISLGFTGFEQLISETSGSFSFGDQPSAVDAFLIPQIFNAHRFEVDLTPFPNIQKVEANCKSTKGFQDAHPDNQPDTP